MYESNTAAVYRQGLLGIKTSTVLMTHFQKIINQTLDLRTKQMKNSFHLYSNAIVFITFVRAKSKVWKVKELANQNSLLQALI